MNIKKMKKLVLTLFTFMIFSCCLSFDSQAAMDVNQVKSRISTYSDCVVKTENGVVYLEYKKWDASEEKMFEIISNIAQSLMGEPVDDYCRVEIKFFFSPEHYGSDFQEVFDKLSLVKKKFGNFFTEWSRYNKLTMSATSYNGGKYFSANFKLFLNGSEQDKYGKEYDSKLLSLVAKAQDECDSTMERVQFFLRWLDENAKYMIFTGYTNDPRYALNVGYTVCGGYANAFKDLCNAAGIPAIVPVNQQANHAWSQVYVDGVWYTADLCNVVKSKSGKYNGYLFRDPDLSTDCNDFVEKYKKAYVESFKYRNVINLSHCKFAFKDSFSYSGKSIKPEVKVTFAGNSLKNGVHYKTSYSSNKYPGTGKIVIEGIKENGYTGKKTLSFKIGLPKVGDITAVSGKTSVKLTWKAVAGVDGYTVRMYNYKTGEYKNLKNIKGTSYTVTKLTEGKKYKFAVRAYVSENGSIYRGDSKSVTVYTLPGKVKNLKAYSVTDTSLKLKWSAMDVAEKYEVQISTDGKTWKNLSKVKKNTCIVKELEANKKYYFRVRAVSDEGKGYYSSKKEVKTLMARPAIKASAGKGTITVSWEKIKGVSGYMVACAGNEDMINIKKVTVKKADKTKATVKGLRSKKNYYVRVRAYKNVSGEKVYGNYSKIIRVKTK